MFEAIEYFATLDQLRNEKKHLDKELAENVVEESSYHKGPRLDARYARALRIQSIDREIASLKRKHIVKVYDAEV